jgi:hypothetical protein
MNPKLSKYEAIAEIMKVTGSDEVTANFIYEIETGAQTGDSLAMLPEGDPSKTYVIDRGHDQPVYTENVLQKWRLNQSQQQPE